MAIYNTILGSPNYHFIRVDVIQLSHLSILYLNDSYGLGLISSYPITETDIAIYLYTYSCIHCIALRPFQCLKNLKMGSPTPNEHLVFILHFKIDRKPVIGRLRVSLRVAMQNAK